MKHKHANVSWKEMDDLNCEDAWQFFKSEYRQVVDNHVPKRRPRTNNKPLWMKANIKKSVKKKHQLYKKYINTSQYKDYVNYVKQKKETKKAVIKAQADYEAKIMREFKEKLSSYSTTCVRKKQKVKTGIS